MPLVAAADARVRERGTRDRGRALDLAALDRLAARAAGFQEHLSKPVDGAGLVSAVLRVIGGS
jgi:CheY-like chemotaxis protein